VISALLAHYACSLRCMRSQRQQRDSDESKGKRADCLDELHPCVKADGPANVCAEQVRLCLIDSMPSASDVVPQDATDLHGESDESEDRTDSGKPSDDAGIGHGKSNRAHADAGARGQ
jgi:hypothetical protein